MPGRLHTFLNGGIYHVFNRTILKQKLFCDVDVCRKFLDIIKYYRSSESIIRFSKYQKLTPIFKQYYNEKISDTNNFRVSMLAYCLMPTHYHFLLQQKQDNGVSFFISQIQNSVTKYYNVKNNYVGPIFLHRFKSKPIYNDEQLKHVSRYIHLNPFSDSLVAKKQDILKYPWSSFHTYIFSNKDKLIEKNFLLLLFDNNISRYKKFVLENADYQKTLELCKHSSKW